MDTSDGGWTVIQKRFDGSTDFYRNWIDYQEGFGDLNSEFWAGLQLVHQLTQTGNWVLRIDLEDFDDTTAYAEYQPFQVGGAESNYTLTIGSYSGTAGDSMVWHQSKSSLNNTPFSTYDRDNDDSSRHCAANYREGAWWYRHCARSNLNGRYLGQSGNGNTAMLWYSWKENQSLKKSEMKIRRVQ